MTKQPKACECADPGCNVHTGLSHCEGRGTATLRRIDMEDYSGTHMCQACADDALESGVYDV